MTNNKDSLKVSSFSLMITAFMVAIIITISIPALSYAASYAYVHTSGEVKLVVADAPMTAIAIAPGISEHSGVLLLNSTSDDLVVGDHVFGF